MNYIDNINSQVKEYYNLLEPDYPEWLNDYINTKELLHQQYISVTCGTIYSNLFESDFFYSSLDHSIGVALIIWHFTHSKKATLAGLFHDIATPAFKHCIDFLKGDYMNQEATEEETTSIIKNSNEIMNLLKKDNIKLEDVDNYQLYPIAENDTPKLSADRLEYSLSHALFTYKLADLETIKRIYNDIHVGINEESISELSFTNIEPAISFVELTSKLSIIYREDRTRYSMQLIADIIKRLINDKILLLSDLYTLKESEIISIIEKSQYKDIFNKWRNSNKVLISKTTPKGVYYVHLSAKIRYIIPLVNNKRIDLISRKAQKLIEDNLRYNMNNYVYLDFDF